MRTCLVVDDSRVVRKVAARIVEALAFEPIEAADGLEALGVCKASMPDAVLVDWAMPVMDGVEFVRQLRREPDGDKPTIVFCTAETEPERIAEALAAGADEYVMKPFDADIIVSKFSTAGLL